MKWLQPGGPGGKWGSRSARSITRPPGHPLPADYAVPATAPATAPANLQGLPVKAHPPWPKGHPNYRAPAGSQDGVPRRGPPAPPDQLLRDTQGIPIKAPPATPQTPLAAARTTAAAGTTAVPIASAQGPPPPPQGQPPADATGPPPPPAVVNDPAPQQAGNPGTPTAGTAKARATSGRGTKMPR